jgi:hypothetical protein
MAERPAAPERLLLAGPAGRLEALVAVPEQFDGARVGVICHPHPLHGGTMDNKVVHTIARTFEELGLATVRFNFRGVGQSGGAFDDGIGETEDARAVCEWARGRWQSTELWLAGFSFGSYVATRLAAGAGRLGVTQLVTIAPPVQRFAFSGSVGVDCPWLIVQGDQDDLVDVNAVRRWSAGLVPAARLVVLAGVDHFFHGRLHELKDVLRVELQSAVH